MAESEAPLPGQIVEHFFLWSDEREAGRAEGRKPRPCLIVAVERSFSPPRVTVLPITSRKPAKGSSAVAVPANIRARIGLDHARDAWVIVDEANVFGWPGFDLVPKPGGGFVRGVVTSGFFGVVRDAVLQQRARGAARSVDRD